VEYVETSRSSGRRFSISVWVAAQSFNRFAQPDSRSLCSDSQYGVLPGAVKAWVRAWVAARPQAPGMSEKAIMPEPMIAATFRTDRVFSAAAQPPCGLLKISRFVRARRSAARVKRRALARPCRRHAPSFASKRGRE
jgi:hypothetical protein